MPMKIRSVGMDKSALMLPQSCHDANMSKCVKGSQYQLLRCTETLLPSCQWPLHSDCQRHRQRPDPAIEPKRKFRASLGLFGP